MKVVVVLGWAIAQEARTLRHLSGRPGAALPSAGMGKALEHSPPLALKKRHSQGGESAWTQEGWSRKILCLLLGGISKKACRNTLDLVSI